MTPLPPQLGTAFLLVTILAGSPAPEAGPCDDPLPIDPQVVTKEMNLKVFRGAKPVGPTCYLSWEEGGSHPGILIYGPSGLADVGLQFTSSKQAADHYAGEAPKGVEPVPGVTNGYMVFDPKIPNRRVFVQYKHQVYMIVSQDKVPLGILAKAVIQE